jgi:hypothetical protein
MRSTRFVIAISFMALLFHAATDSQAQEKSKLRPTWSRLAKGTTVVVGEVTAIDAKPIEALPNTKSKEKLTYRVATIKVNELILGAKDLKEVKVGFAKEDELKKEQEACFILMPHHEQPFYIYDDVQYDLFNTDHRYFDLRTRILRHSAKCLEAPNEMLKSQEPRDRLLTAAILISRYREASVGSKTEPIDVEQSKLILRALRDADWGKEDKSYRLQPQPLFDLLGLTEKDGWNAPKAAGDKRLAAENWLIDHHNTYRILRFVKD